MIDLVAIDKMYEVSRAAGALFRWDVFNKKVLAPLSMLSEMVEKEADLSMTEAELRDLSEQGWFPILDGCEGEGGVPLYVPSRIKLLVELRGYGWGPEELRLVAENEEQHIDNILAAEELEYLDDDVDTLVLYVKSRIDALDHVMGDPTAERTGELERLRKQLVSFEGLVGRELPERTRASVEKMAFRVRATNDVTRLWLLEGDRGALRAGFSPLVACRKSHWSMDDGFQGEGVMWDLAISAAIAHGRELSDEPPLRVPGFLLKGEQILSTRTLRPGQYAELWKAYDLDVYLETWARLHGERRCLNCFAPLPSVTAGARRFCSEKCRNATKQRRFRERNPEAAERAQAKYWKSLGDLEPEGNVS